ncbi:SAM-dependent methyltransferase [Weissella confusa]|uniref:SAM-dependent methyltransferase n=1 Tax=Weissella fermenti TaxID=2987699 RepID=A0ABT6D0S2_9LACO|nr:MULTISPECIES: SAM-dependent methyltransferase [Weissella]MBJ7687717.1 SAM-dependent methyltransferase [Weissella confusa]MCW0926634.1 SAM-dependent methyltransferase [Weissella sp. LMG 11983]MDF9299060.1 SAM-dependent methyltransferase [Weissella sp. BK2]
MTTNQAIRFGSGQQLTEMDYLGELLPYLGRYQNIPTMANLMQQAIDTLEQLNAGYLPAALPTMEVPESVIPELQSYVLAQYPDNADAGNALWLELTEPLEDIDFLLRHLRDALIEYFSMYGFVSSDFVRDLSAYTDGQPVLELMAGHGYISAGLKAIAPEQKIIATDNEDWRTQPDPTSAKPVTDVENMDAIAALDMYGENVSTVIMSWAPDTTDADWQVLQYIRDNQYRFDFDFIVIGEKDGATDSDVFWHEAELEEVPALNAHHHSFDLIDERVYLVK